MKWKRWKWGMRRRSDKALPHRSTFKGFWGTIPVIYATLNSPKQDMGRYLGFYATIAHVTHLSPLPVVIHRIITDFSTIY